MPMKGRRCNARSNEHNNTTLKKKKKPLGLNILAQHPNHDKEEIRTMGMPLECLCILCVDVSKLTYR